VILAGDVTPQRLIGTVDGLAREEGKRAAMAAASAGFAAVDGARIIAEAIRNFAAV
jgi:UDP-N-acetylglucosamine:LPS N-acetylglucosamine transferase